MEGLGLRQNLPHGWCDQRLPLNKQQQGAVDEPIDCRLDSLQASQLHAAATA
jgi:hypothetical protein